MQNAFGPLISMCQTQLEASRCFADAVFAGAEKIDRMMIGATHRAYSEQLRFALSLTRAGDLRSAGDAFRSDFLTRDPDNALNYQKEFLHVVAEVQNDIGHSLHDYAEQMGAQADSAASASQDAKKRANDAILNPMTGMLAVWESAFREVAALAENSAMTGGAASGSDTGMTERSTTTTAYAAAGTGPNGGTSDSVIITDGNAVGSKKGSSPLADGRRK